MAELSRFGEDAMKIQALWPPGLVNFIKR